MAQTANNTHTTSPTGYGADGTGNVSTEGNIVLTYPAAASTHYYRRDLVTVSTTAGTVSKCSAKNSVFDGVVLEEVDNSSGAAGDKYVSVLVKGFVDLNGFVEATGETEDDTITYNDLVYLSADTEGVGAGQKVTATNATSTVVGRALDNVTVGAADINAVIKVYVNCVEKSFS